MWVDRLPALITELEREWSFQIRSVLEGGTEALVAEVTLAGGTAAVLKLPVPCDTDDAAHEILVLRLVDGEGCPSLFRADAERGLLPSEIDLQPIGRQMLAAAEYVAGQA